MGRRPPGEQPVNEDIGIAHEINIDADGIRRSGVFPHGLRVSKPPSPFQSYTMSLRTRRGTLTSQEVFAKGKLSPRNDEPDGFGYNPIFFLLKRLGKTIQPSCQGGYAGARCVS